MKFGNLLKKELSELITPQAIFSMLFTCVLLIVLGQVMGSAMEEGFNTSTVNICDLDNTEYTQDMLKNLESYGTTPDMVDIQGDDYAAELDRLGINNAVIIPAGYTDSILKDNSPAELIYVSKLGTGLAGSMKTISASDAVSAIQSAATNDILLKTYGLSEEEITKVRTPVQTVEFTVSNGKTAQISPDALTAVLMFQSMIAPFVVFFLLLMAAQMIMTAISTEKIDKTLETLLSAPVSRMSILTAKMLAAVIVALLNAAFMVVGFIFYIGGMTGGALESVSATADIAASAGTALSVPEAMNALGLTIGAGGYLLFGVQLFLTVAIGLSISLILGAFAEDVKSVQTLVMPIMILVMIPFFLTLFLDMNTVSPVIKAITYIIPFSHTYLALNNLMAGNTALFFGGIAYQLIFFIVCMFIAVRIFTTDKIFTMSSAITEKLKGGKKKQR